MGRNPNWNEEELKLALELYLSHDLKWLSRISDTTHEIIILSKILNHLDYHDGRKSDKFRSVGSIRMKLSNFKSVDPRYNKQSLSNIGQQDRVVFEKYWGNYTALAKECLPIIQNHYVGQISDEEKTYISRFTSNAKDMTTDSQRDHFVDFYNYLGSFIDSIGDSSYSDLQEQCIALSNSIKKIIQIPAEIMPEHGGINQEVVSKQAKVGKSVRVLLERAINEMSLSSKDIELLQSKEWSKQTFHINHAFLKPVEPNISPKVQIRDDNGYIRYWKQPYEIMGIQYFVCKEWFEANRKYVTSWFSSILEKRKLCLSEDLFLKIVKKIKELDEKEICIKVNALYASFPNEKKSVDDLIEYMVKTGVLISFQGSLRDFTIDDYDAFYEMVNNPKNYLK